MPFLGKCHVCGNMGEAGSCCTCDDDHGFFDRVLSVEEGTIPYYPTDDEGFNPDNFQEFNSEHIEKLRNIAYKTVWRCFPNCSEDDYEEWVQKFVRKMQNYNIGTIRKFIRKAFWHDAYRCICPDEGIRQSLITCAHQELNDGSVPNYGNFVSGRDRTRGIIYPSDDEYDSDEDSVEYSDSDIQQIKNIANKTVDFHYPTCRPGERDEWVERFVRRMKFFKIATIAKFLNQAFSRINKCCCSDGQMRVTLIAFAQEEQRNATANPPGQPE